MRVHPDRVTNKSPRIKVLVVHKVYCELSVMSYFHRNSHGYTYINDTIYPFISEIGP